MRIAIITYSLHIGGTERFIYNLAKFFIKEENDVEVFEAEEAGEWRNYFLENGIRVRTFPISFFTVPWLHTKYLGKILIVFDAIFLIDIPLAQAALGLLNEKTICIPIIQLSIPSMYRNAISNSGQWNVVVAVSNQIKNNLINDYKIESSQVKMIPNAINIGKYPNNEFNLSKKIKFLFVGRIEDTQKGVFLLPEIIRELFSKYSQTELTVIGDGPDLKKLQIKFKEFNLTDRIHFTGYLSNEQVVEELKNHHFLIMPSNQEGLPFVLLEAMSCGVIPIASYLPGITDMVIKEGFNGYFGMPGDSSTFSKAAIKAIENVIDLELISKNAYQTVFSNFSVEKMGEMYVELIKTNKNSKIDRNNKIDLITIDYVYPFLPIIFARAFRKLETFFNKFT